MAAFLLLLLPALAMARIEVELSGKYNGDQSKMAVHVSGSEAGIISDVEMQTFGLDEGNLKDAVRAYFGKRPDDAFLRSPTPWGDLYQTYSWSQVIRTLVPKTGRILKITSQPQIVAEQILENNNTKPTSFNVGIAHEVQNRLMSSWSKGGDLTVGKEIVYDFDIELVSVGRSTSMSYTSSWGEDVVKSSTATIGAPMELLLQPGQSVLAQLQAVKGHITVEVEYEATLSGSVATNYNDSYKGHRFWSLDVQGVMAGGNLSNKVGSKQVIDIEFFANTKLMVQDRSSGNKMIEVSL